ncbi:MAG TPA: glycosyltransferase family 39 protein [Candidatus Lumbricidophila sp.]|nr:glycosyltransferase family 39 protein [Candidatus Lumbricidophila sp.]
MIPHLRARPIGAAVLAGLVVGVIALGGVWGPSLWSDEAATISAATRSWAELWAMFANIDLVHGLYYLGMHVWVSAFGTAPVALRLPSGLAIAGAGSCVWLIANRLRGRRFAWWSVAAFALLPRVFWAGIEARPYAFTVLIAAASTLALLRALDTATGPTRHRIGRWAVYALLSLIGVLANVYLALLVVGHLVSICWDRQLSRRQRVEWLAAAGATGLVSVPFLAALARQSGQIGDHEIGLLVILRNVVVNQWFLGDTPTLTNGVAPTAITLTNPATWWFPAAIIVTLLGWALIAVGVWRDRFSLRGTPSALSDRDRPALVWTLPWAVLPAIIIGGYSLLVSPMYGARYLTFATPAVAMLLVVGFSAIRPAVWRRAVAGALVLAVLPIYVSQRMTDGKNGSDWAQVAEYLAHHARDGQGVYFTPTYAQNTPTVRQTSRGIAVAYPDAFRGLRDITLLRTPAEANTLAGESRSLDQSAAQLVGLDTVWMVRRNDYSTASAGADEAFLATLGFKRVATVRVGALDQVVRFDR